MPRDALLLLADAAARRARAAGDPGERGAAAVVFALVRCGVRRRFVRLFLARAADVSDAGLVLGQVFLYRFADGAREARDVLLLPRLRPQNTVGRAARAAGGQFDGLLYHDGDAAFVYPDTLAFVCGRRDLRPCNQRLSLRRRGKVDRISSARADRLCEKRNARRGGRKSFKRKSACKF